MDYSGLGLPNGTNMANYGRYPMSINQKPQQKNGIKWVQGIEGAKAYQLEPNSNAQLMDSENDGVFYIKVCDDIGMCSLRIFDYKERENVNTQSQNNIGVNTDEIVNKIAEKIAKSDALKDVHSVKSVQKLLMRENVDDQAPLRITVIKENPLANYDDYVPNKLPFLRSLPLV